MRSLSFGRVTRALPLLVALRAGIGDESAGPGRILDLTPNDPPRFVAGNCPPNWRLPDGVDSAFVRCGTVTVPQSRATDSPPGLRPVVLSVVTYSSKSVRPGATPVVFLAGGPGESAIGIVSELMLKTPTGQLLLRQRPIISFDQRGFGARAGRAQPNLGPLVYAPADTREASLAVIVDSARRIAQGLRERGVDPKNFTTFEAVADLHDVIRALGYSKVVLFGTSYGTRYALQFMRAHANMVEAAILDGVAPPQRDDIFEPEQVEAARRRVMSQIAADCATDPACNAEYANLPMLVEQLDRADAKPLHVTANYPWAGGWRTLELRPRSVLSTLGAFAGTEPIRSMLPQLLMEFARGDTLRLAFAPQLALVAAAEDRVVSDAGPFYPVAYHTVLCAEMRRGVPQAGGRAVCDALGVPFAGGDAIAPVHSAVPTLLLSSAYDAQTPPALADETARTLTNGFQVLFHGVGHVVFPRPAAAACAAVVVESFLSDMHQTPAADCVEDVIPTFLPRSVDVTGMTR